MATVTKGKTFISGETVEPADMHQLVDNATVTNIVNADISDDTITNAKIKSDAAIAFSKLAALDSANILVGNASNVATKVAVTGDVTISNAGVTTIGAGKITPAMLTGAQIGAAPIYGCRAWVNFDGTFTNVTGNSYSRTGTTVTVTKSAHGLTSGNKLVVSSATDTGLNTAANTASVEITVTDANNFTFQTSSTGASTGTLTYARGIRGSGNVASVERTAPGTYTITFSTAMQDANYAAVFGGQSGYVGLDATTRTTTTVQVVTTQLSSNSQGSAANQNSVDVAIFR